MFLDYWMKGNLDALCSYRPDFCVDPERGLDLQRSVGKLTHEMTVPTAETSKSYVCLPRSTAHLPASVCRRDSSC